MSWQTVLPNVRMYRDSCNVYAITDSQGTLVVNAGTGKWLDRLDDVPGSGKPITLAITHRFRDHAAGAAKAAARGIDVFVPDGDREILADPAEHLRRRETYIIYDNHWDLFVPITPTRIAGVLQDYDRLNLAGLDVEVVPLSGVTMTQVGLAVTLAENDGPVIFCGEAIHSPGRIARIAPLQYNYKDLPGAVHVYDSARTLRQMKPAALLPSLGEPMLDDTDSALAKLQTSMRDLAGGRPGLPAEIKMIDNPSLEKVTDHVYQDMHSGAISWFLLNEDYTKALVIDYGYRAPMSVPDYPRRYTRRPLLHGLDALRQKFGIDFPEVVLISHFHDDHVCGVPVLQRVFNVECWAAENFANLLEQPEAHCFPCTWPVPMKVTRRIGLDEKVQWEQFTFHFAPMNGHTRYAALIGFQADGKRFAHTGDQYFFDFGIGDWANNRINQNHVYRNGCLLNGFIQSGGWMLDWRPDIVLSGHAPPMHTDDDYFKLIDDWTAEYDRIHRQAMPLDDAESHRDVDSWGGYIWPYRTHVSEPGSVTVSVTVRNPLPRRATLSVRLVGPDGWKGTSTAIDVDPHADATCALSITPTTDCRRAPFAAEVEVDGQPLGQVAEALMTVGGEMW